ncbi:hypothetical protein NBRC10513_004102 [Rhodotorula toruloides]|uniref:Uncharacterized protein n=1 Tax=Rhodotorula toruloides TaxID=5286 RepID=A0A2T0A0M6_RHOTO|nr:hypothetical protein AAT19DRAFT_10413 [Rhodotorula toruloides]
MDDADIFAAFTHLSPAYEAHEIPEEEDTMPTLNSPVHPIPVAQTAGAFLRHNLPTVVQRYLRFWHTAICRKPLDEFWQWYEPLLTYIGRGTGHAHDPLLVAVTPPGDERRPTTTVLSLVDNGPHHRFNLPHAGPRIWVDNANGATVLDTTEVSGPSYEDWEAGRYGAPWTVDSHSPHLTDAFQHELKWHFHRVVWRMLGPFAQTGHGNTQHNPSVLVEHGETWRPTYTIHRLAIWHGAACDTPLHLAVNFMSRHEPARRTSVIAPHMLFNH